MSNNTNTNYNIPEPEYLPTDYISLTTHNGHFGSNPIEIKWGAADPMERGPVIATVKHGGQRNAIGAHGGGYCIYTALAVAAGNLDPAFSPDLRSTQPVHTFGPFDSWKDPKRIVTIDPWGHETTKVFAEYYKKVFLFYFNFYFNFFLFSHLLIII